jgi:DNA-directed RNA polymerase subunit RPC12/RpoP
MAAAQGHSQIMALINCPDCGTQISDAAEACIRCGRPVRLSREAILAEIAEEKREIDRMQELIDYVINCEHYDPSHTETNRNAWDKIEKCSARIQKLESMLGR